jgi:hypothetical protein
VGCGDKAQDKKGNTESFIPSETMESVQETSNTVSETPDTSQNENDAEKENEKANSPGDEVKPLSDKQIEKAKQAALDYYANTVFEVNSINYIGTDKSPFSCTFSVNVSKDGVVQEPDRMICLKKENKTWKIISEGY